MKKVITALFILSLVFGIFAPVKNVRAAGLEAGTETTPSGIAYDEIGSKIDGYVKSIEGGLASCEVSVFNRDGVIYNGYYGYSDIGNKVKADADTVYEWGSCSKILVWVSVMQQWERGNIDLDADIRTYLPEGFLTKLRYPGEKITMINLMNHNAGFQESFYENEMAGADGLFGSLEEAVKTCECYQAFHVGEVTAYSNWGVSLAAYIVECTSGLDYVTYVNENIFKPLGMEHTSIDPLQADNTCVAEKRHELKCYSVSLDSFEDYGECPCYVQLFPAGAAMGTLGDLTKFGQALVREDSPLFNSNSTREEMFKTTAYFGDNETKRNSHGLWVSNFKIDVLGHDGNTAGCTTALQFDPVSGLGVAVMTNEAGETAFCYGIPKLLYGSFLDREGYEDIKEKYAGLLDIKIQKMTGEIKSAGSSEEDISGCYTSKRNIVTGAGKCFLYGQIMPLSKNDDGTYSVRLFGFDIDNAVFIPLGGHKYLYVNNGMESIYYFKNDVMETTYCDTERDYNNYAGFIGNYLFIIFGLICLAVLLVKLAAYVMRKIRKTEKKYTGADKLIFTEQLIYAVSGLIFAAYTMMSFSCTKALVTVSAILAGLLGLLSFAIGGLLSYTSIKSELKTRTKIKRFIWVVLSFGYFEFILFYELYKFWTL